MIIREILIREILIREIIIKKIIIKEFFKWVRRLHRKFLRRISARAK